MDEKIVIKIVDSFGVHCVSIEDGANLYKQLLHFLPKYSIIYLDFKNVAVITSSFLNASIGRLVGKLGADFNDRIQWLNLDSADANLMNLVIANAKEHFAKNGREKQIETIVNRRHLG